MIERRRSISQAIAEVAKSEQMVDRDEDGDNNTPGDQHLIPLDVSVRTKQKGIIRRIRMQSKELRIGGKVTEADGSATKFVQRRSSGLGQDSLA